MANYENVIPLTLMYEGGDTFTNIKEDKGGATKWGVSLLFIRGTNDEMFDLNGDGVLNANDIRLMTEEVATLGFKKYFWDTPYGLDWLDSDKKAFVVFDAAVNNGPGNATKFIQRAVRALGMDCDVDGKFGRQTAKCLKDAPVEEFCDAFLNAREDFFRAIVERNPSQRIFINGWLNRIKNIRRDMQSLTC